MLVASVRSEQPHSGKLLQSYSEKINYILEKDAIDQAVNVYDMEILCYVQTTKKTPRQLPDDSIANSCRIAEYMTNVH